MAARKADRGIPNPAGHISCSAGTTHVEPITSLSSVLISLQRQSHFAPASSTLAGLLVLLITLAFESAFAQSTGRPVMPSNDPSNMIDSGVVVAVRFEGNEEISDGELSTIVSTRPAKLLGKWIAKIVPSLGTPEQFADRVVLDGDVQNIEMYYQNNGFLEADVEVEQRFDSTDLVRWLEVYNRNRITARQNRIPLPKVRDTVVFWISEGPEYTVGGVSFVGLESLPEEFQPELTERNTIRIGERWSGTAAEAEVARLRGILQENGYPFFKKDTIIAEAVQDKKIVRVIPYLNAGNRYRFGKIRIEYDSTREDSRVSDRVIMGYMVDIDSGEWYKESVVRVAEQYLYRLNTFDVVSIQLDTSVVQSVPYHLRDSMALPVRVRLRMRPTQEIVPGVFVGMGRDIGFAGGGTISYINRNIFGGAQRFDLDLFGQFLPSWQPRYSAAVTLLFPYLGVRNFPLSIGVSSIYTRQFNRENSDVLEFTDINHRLRFSSTILIGGFDSRTSISPELTAEYVDFLDYEGKQVRHYLSDNFYFIKDTTERRKQLNSILATYGQWDRSDDFLNPSRGFILNGGAEGAFGFPGLESLTPQGFSTALYLKGLIQERVYTDLGTGGAFVIAAKARVGATLLFAPEDPMKEPPRERRFFGGGSASNRGWNSQELMISNKLGARTTDGGYQSLESSLEFRFAPFRPNLELADQSTVLSPFRIALFSDAGNVWDYDIPVAINQVAWTVGIGLRYNIFIGPLRVDWGFKVYDPNPGLNDDYFAAPGNTRGRWIFDRRIFVDDVWTLHFGLGQAF